MICSAKLQVSVVIWACLGLARMAAGAELAWLQPEGTVVTPGAAISTVAVAGDVFGERSGAVPSDQAIAVNGRLDNETLFIPGAVVDPAGLRFTATFPRPGVAVLAVTLKPEVRELPRGAVERYLRMIHANDDIRAAWAAMEDAPSWREIRLTALKTYLRVGEPAADDRTWTAMAPAGLDLVPETDPTTLRAGAEVTVRVVRDGRPVAGCVVDYVSNGEMREHVVLSGPDGRAAATVDTRGPWLVRVIDLHRSTAKDHDWDTGIVALSVNVR